MLILAGDDHRRVRKMMAHAFTTSHVRAVHPTMREYCDLLVALLMRNKEYGERDFLLCMKHTALDIGQPMTMLLINLLTIC